MNNIERQAADTILEKGVRVSLPAPFFVRLIKKQVSLVFRQPKMGTLLEVARHTLAADFDITKLETGEMNEAHKLVLKHARTLARIAAILFLNSKWKIRWFSRLLSGWLLWNLTPRKLAEIALIAAAFGGVQDFTTTIRLLGAMQIKATGPRLSPEEKGS